MISLAKLKWLIVQVGEREREREREREMREREREREREERERVSVMIFYLLHLGNWLHSSNIFSNSFTLSMEFRGNFK